MARTHVVEHCRKSPGNCGKCGVTIKKGEAYYWWAFRYGGKHIRCRLHSPRQSDLTSSDKLSRAYAASEGVEDAVSALRQAVVPVTVGLTSDDPGTDPVPGVEALYQAVEDLKGSLEEQASEAEDIASEYNESADNIEQTFSSSSTADECREKAETLEGWSGTLQGVEVESEASWQPFLSFLSQGVQDGSLLGLSIVKDLPEVIAKASDDKATAEDWQTAFDRLRDLRRSLLNGEAVALFDEAVDSAADALEGFAGEAESAAGELGL